MLQIASWLVRNQNENTFCLTSKHFCNEVSGIQPALLMKCLTFQENRRTYKSHAKNHFPEKRHKKHYLQSKVTSSKPINLDSIGCRVWHHFKGKFLVTHFLKNIFSFNYFDYCCIEGQPELVIRNTWVAQFYLLRKLFLSPQMHYLQGIR